LERLIKGNVLSVDSAHSKNKDLIISPYICTDLYQHSLDFFSKACVHARVHPVHCTR